MTEELKKEIHHFIANHCEAVSFDINHRLMYHYSDMEKVAEFAFNKATKELQEELNYQKQARSIAENAVVDLSKKIEELSNRLEAQKETIASFDADLKPYLNELEF